MLALSGRERWQRLALIITAISGILSVLSQSQVGVLHPLYKPIFAAQLDVLQQDQNLLHKLADQASADLREISDSSARIEAAFSRFNKTKDVGPATAVRQSLAPSNSRPEAAKILKPKHAFKQKPGSTAVAQGNVSPSLAYTHIHDELLILSTTLISTSRNIYESVGDIYDSIRNIKDQEHWNVWRERYVFYDFNLPEFIRTVALSYAVDMRDGRAVPLSEVLAKIPELPTDWEYRWFSGYEGGWQSNEAIGKAAMKELGERFTPVPDTSVSTST